MHHVINTDVAYCQTIIPLGGLAYCYLLQPAAMTSVSDIYYRTWLHAPYNYVALSGIRRDHPPGKNAFLHCTTAGFTLQSFGYKSFAELCLLALLSHASYPILVHRLAVSLHASSPQSVTVLQLRFTSFAVASLWEDLHLQECAHAGRTQKSPGDHPGLAKSYTVIANTGVPM
ncbi:hypothetical protein ALON55S_06291 [Alishewanella longhuensis]